MSSATDICLYGSAWIGMLGAIVEPTDIEGILELNCNNTDFFSNRKEPTYLVYNPYFEEKSVTLSPSFDKETDIYDLVSNQYIKKKHTGKISIAIPSNSAMVLVCLPTGQKRPK